MNPLVSIGVPSYNGAQFIAECLESILGQTFEDFEVIIVDDCSTDETIALAKTYAKEDRRISIHVNPSRLGLVGNFNRCVALAHGKYVCIFGQDDVMLPDNLGHKVKLLELYPNAGFVHSNIYQIDERGDIFKEHWKPQSTGDYVTNGREFFRDLIAGTNHICCPSVLVRKECFSSLGYFLEKLFFACDWEMWMRIALKYDVACIGRPLVKYRRHSSSETSRVERDCIELEQEYLAKKIILSRQDARHGETSKLARQVMATLAEKSLRSARRAFYENNLEASRTFWRTAFKVDPRVVMRYPHISLGLKLLLGSRGLRTARILKSRILSNGTGQ
jgi:glycosyltransferase involved in cell wall biosynthesis